MNLILNIDTSSYYPSVALSDNENIIAHSENNSHNTAGVLLTTIKDLLNNSGYKIKDLSAIAVNIGPGSYTGLRIGLAAAKGLCYSSGLPIISVNGLTALANEAIKQNKHTSGAYIVLYNNYRNGWYYAAYDEKLNTLLPPGSSTSIDDIISLVNHKPVFICGVIYDNKNNMPTRNNIVWLSNVELNAIHLASIASSVIINPGSFNLSNAQLLYINSIF